MAGLKPEFDKRNTKIIGLSVDPVERPQALGRRTSRRRRATRSTYPLIGDSDLKVAKLYDMLHPNASGDGSRARRPTTRRCARCS